MNLKNTKKYIWIFLLCCLPLSNILWYVAYSSGDESVAASLVILTSFLPALTALILCKISREGWDNLMILPNIRKAWKAYLFAVIGALVMNYLNELLMYLMFRGIDGTADIHSATRNRHRCAHFGAYGSYRHACYSAYSG